jgi:hypothetical protein
MDISETDIKAKKLWDDMSIEIRVKFLLYIQFWEGFSHYLYEYLPEDIQDKLRLKIVKNDPDWL